MIGIRTNGVRARAARKKRTLDTLYAEARIPKGSGPFSFCSTQTGLAPRARSAINGSHHFGGRSLTICGKTPPVLAGDSSCSFADVAQQAERDHAMVEATSSRLVIRSTSGVPMHSVAAQHGVGGAGCARPATWVTCSDTPHPTGCSRVDTTDVDYQAPVAQLAEQPPCKRQAARSIRRRGHQD